MHRVPCLAFSHPANPPAIEKEKLKLTFHLPHKYFWQALLAFMLQKVFISVCPWIPSWETRGTMVAWAGPIPATAQGQEVAQP